MLTDTTTHPLLQELNPKQAEAVCSEGQNLFVLAGAGSGKTRVLVHRIAWLVQARQVSPYAILAVTFTNKAANEMRSRIEALLEHSVRGMWVGTFHSLAHRLLRQHWQAANLNQHFQIMDTDDQMSLIKRVMKSLNIDRERFSPKQVMQYISQKKEQGVRPHMIDEKADFVSRVMQKIYTAYQTACEQGALVDFSELLLRSHELFLNHPDILNHYRQRFAHILVDEFQDTNSIQYAWLRVLCSDNNRITLVGDDDQSIYGFRGAKVENIQLFTREFPNAHMVRLEQNYRSTGNILAAANAVIANNENRLGKSLWTELPAGDRINIYAAFNDFEEARFVVEHIRAWVADGNRHDSAAVLYRSNAQSRLLEEAFIEAGVPYRIYGGLRFFDRAEIKDALAYLRLVFNPNDDAAFERVVNKPARSIGEQTLLSLRTRARESMQSLWQVTAQIVTEQTLASRAQNALQRFVSLIQQLTAETQTLSLAKRMERIINVSGLMAMYAKKEKGETALTRIENLKELILACEQFEEAADPEENLIETFLTNASLEAGEQQSGEHSDCVQLMTLHSAKGLEFPLVFITGMEEGLFPHQMSAGNPKGLEEERRLAYVGMTRAREQLYLLYGETRHLYGQLDYRTPSRFISEIPPKLRVNLRAGSKQPFQAKPKMTATAHSASTAAGTTTRTTPRAEKPSPESQSSFYIGQSVSHPSYGEGIVIDLSGSGDRAIVKVKFKRQGVKQFLLSLAKLVAV